MSILPVHCGTFVWVTGRATPRSQPGIPALRQRSYVQVNMLWGECTDQSTHGHSRAAPEVGKRGGRSRSAHGEERWCPYCAHLRGVASYAFAAHILCFQVKTTLMQSLCTPQSASPDDAHEEGHAEGGWVENQYFFRLASDGQIVPNFKELARWVFNPRTSNRALFRML